MPTTSGAVGVSSSGTVVDGTAVPRVEVDDEIRDGHERQAMGVRERPQVLASHHRTLVMDELRDDGDLTAVGQAAQFDPGLRVSGALAHAAVAGDEGQHVARSRDRRGIR